ncbi:hypothetical protein ANN_05700 [Periplaneta americana]|uniref:Uncharacterized protein n=1 Tax=Periplaneta americana TaxID=6978 RepID=A0ABQ8TDB6_PERAM|nr:hypothetical protein ANN_05700 [Periplaneta americana]
MSPGSSTESYPAFARIGLRENPGKNLNQKVSKLPLVVHSQNWIWPQGVRVVGNKWEDCLRGLLVSMLASRSGGPGKRKVAATRKRVDSLRSCDELEVAEEACVAPDSSPAGCFVFPPPPPPPIIHPRRPVSASSYCYSVSDSDSQSESGRGHGGQSSPIAIRHPLFTFRGYQSDGSPVALHSLPRFLPPIGVFWDIENCQVPKGRSALAVAQVIRDKFFKGYREAEFLVVCDVKKENSQVIQELNDAQRRSPAQFVGRDADRWRLLLKQIQDAHRRIRVQ